MKYFSIDRISDFEFHDVILALNSLNHNCLSVRARHLNIHRDALQNPFQNDMEISEAIINFEGINIISYKCGGYQTYDEKGNSICSTPEITFYDNEALERFLEQLECGTTVDYLGGEKEVCIVGMGEEPFFEVHFNFRRVIIEWDDYEKEAWYVSWNKDANK